MLELLRPDVAAHFDDWLRSLPFAIHPPRLTKGRIEIAAA